mgnify:CR=1 FL=1
MMKIFFAITANNIILVQFSLQKWLNLESGASIHLMYGFFWIYFAIEQM